MSKISFTPDASGTGVFTVASPNSNTDRTLTLPDSSGDFVLSASGVISDFESTGIDDNATSTAITIDASENVGIGTASPDGKLNVFSASAGSVTADADADELVLENSGNVGLSLLTASTGESGIYFGNPGTGGQKDFYLKYYHESHATTANRRAFTFNTASTERMRIDSSGNLLFNSGYGSVATAYGCRAWVNFNGNTASVVASGNVSSITDNAAGQQTVNFSTAMPDANYAATMSHAGNNSDSWSQAITSQTTTSVQSTINFTSSGSTTVIGDDRNRVCIIVVR